MSDRWLLQLNARQSEDLDFMRWKQGPKDKLEVGWPNIKKELCTIGTIESEDILGFDHVVFVVNGVKLSFYAAPRKQLSTMQPIAFRNNLRIADVHTIGALKMEVMLRRAKFRDYYDLYSILKSGIDIQDLIPLALEHSDHKLKQKNLLAMITNGDFFCRDSQFEKLSPIYDVTPTDIQEYIKAQLKERV